MLNPYERLSKFDQRGIGVVFKIAERCNLACSYCYFFFGGDESFARHPAIVAPQTVESIAEFLEQAVRELDIGFVEVALHGGEPLLMKKPAFEDLCTRIARCGSERCTIGIAVQSNGVLVDDEWIDILSRHNVGIGLSIDGTREQHDAYRVDKKGRGTYDKTVAGWWRLKAAAREGRIPEPGVLSVISPQTRHDVLSTFVDELDVTRINFLLPDFTHDTCAYSEDEIAQIGELMVAVLDDWRRIGNPRLKVKFVRDAMMAMVSDEGLARARAFKENLWPYVTISSDGGVHIEDTLRSALWTREAEFDVRSHSLREILAADLWAEVAAGAETLPPKCAACRYATVCKGGPMLTRHSKANGFANESIYCAALYRFHSALEERLSAAGRLHPAFVAASAGPRVAEIAR